MQKRIHLELIGPPIRRRIELVQGLRVTLRLHVGEGIDKPDTARVHITDAAGRTAAHFDEDWVQFDYGLAFGLSPGTYAVHATTPTQLSATSTWTVAAGAKPKLDLRLR